MEQGSDEIEPALHTTGESLYLIAATVGELDGVERFVDAGAEIGAAQAVELAKDAEILLGAQFIVKSDGLRDEAERGADCGVGGGERRAVKRERAGLAGRLNLEVGEVRDRRAFEPEGD